MCYSGCPYENWNGECIGTGRQKKGRPHCSEMTEEEWIAEEEEWYDDEDDEY